MIEPIPLQPSYSNPYGVDGNWTAFPLQVGIPAQPFDVFVSTSQAIDYVVLTEACSTDTNPETCAKSRGQLFNTGSGSFTSNTPSGEPNGLIPTDGGLLGNNAVADFGLDYTGWGYPGYTSKEKHVVGGVIDPQLWLGLLGIMANSVANPNNPKSSSQPLLADLKNQSKIPSISWGYTGGAHYQFDYSGPLGSLTLGGYDRTRFIPNDVTFPMDANSGIGKYLSVYIQSIKATTKEATNQQLLPDPIYANLDSTVSYLYLPTSVCNAFERAFNLKYNSTNGFYYISDNARKELLSQKPAPSVTFTLATSMQGGQSVDITLPYLAFDLMLMPPYVVSQPTNYFPIKRTDNSSLYTLGRTFFQEAYVIADFERNNFSVSQCLFQADQTPNLVGIKSPQQVTITHPDNSGSSSNSNSSSNAGVIAGPVVAVVVVLILAALGFWFWRRRKRRQAATDGDADEKGLPAYSDHVAEMDAHDAARRPEKPKTELEATESGRATPVLNSQDALNKTRALGSSPLSSPPVDTDTAANDQSQMNEMDATTTHTNTYFELPGSLAQRWSRGPHEMSATFSPADQPTDEQTSASLPDPPEPSPPLESSTMTSNPLTAAMETVPPPPPPKNL